MEVFNGMGMLNSVWRLICLYLYYRRKKNNNMLSDIVIPLWKARLEEKDVGKFRIKMNIGGDVVASLKVVHVEEFGFFCKNVHLNLEYIGENKYVSHCSFKEFVEYYGDVFMYLLENDGKVDINQIYNI